MRNVGNQTDKLGSVKIMGAGITKYNKRKHIKSETDIFLNKGNKGQTP